MSKRKNVLDRAADLIEEHGLTRFSPRDDDGFCLSGAIAEASGMIRYTRGYQGLDGSFFWDSTEEEDRSKQRTYRTAIRALADTIPPSKRGGNADSGVRVVHYNDYCIKRKATAVRRLREAADVMRAQRRSRAA